MGCCGSKKEILEETRQPYSWENRPKIDLSQYTFTDLEDGCVVKKPGSIDGQQFMVKNCKNTKIYILDYTDNVTVDDCTNCQFVIGPSRGSVFLRNCQDCKCIIACQQFRSRDCSKMNVFLYCSTQPIIESSCKMKFGCYQLAYGELEGQFDSAKLSVFNNNWFNIYDFTPVTEGKNWSLLEENVTVSDLIDLSPEFDAEKGDDGNGDSTPNNEKEIKLSSSPDTSVVPATRGSREKNHTESCFMLVCPSDKSKQVATQIVSSVKAEADLMQAKEVSLSPDQAQRVLSIDKNTINLKTLNQGPVIGLEFNGETCVESCRKALEAVDVSETPVYSSPTGDAASQEIYSFFNFCEMQMSI